MFSKLRPILFLFLPLVIGMSSCLKGDLEDLEKQLADLEKALGSNEPLVMNFSTTTTEGDAIVKNAAFLFKGSDENTNYMEDYQNGSYYIYVERSLDVSFDEYLYVEFEYNADTQTVSNEYVYMSWYDKYWTRINPSFYPGRAGNTFEFTLNSINTETGQVSFSVDVVTDETASNNEYFEQPMTCKINFNGTLGVFID